MHRYLRKLPHLQLHPPNAKRANKLYLELPPRFLPFPLPLPTPSTQTSHRILTIILFIIIPFIILSIIVSSLQTCYHHPTTQLVPEDKAEKYQLRGFQVQQAGGSDGGQILLLFGPVEVGSPFPPISPRQTANHQPTHLEAWGN